VDPVPDPLLLRKSGSAGNRTRVSGSVGRNSGHWTTEVVHTHLVSRSSTVEHYLHCLIRLLIRDGQFSIQILSVTFGITFLSVI
jgi:hypothetical protein